MADEFLPWRLIMMHWKFCPVIDNIKALLKINDSTSVDEARNFLPEKCVFI